VGGNFYSTNSGTPTISKQKFPEMTPYMTDQKYATVSTTDCYQNLRPAPLASSAVHL